MPTAERAIRVKLSHVGIYVRDMEKSLRWYQEILGLRLSDYLPAGSTQEPAAPHGICWLRYDDLHHEVVLIQLPPEALKEDGAGRPTNLQQVAFRLPAESDVQAAYERFRAAGVSIVTPPRRQRVSGGLQFYFADPDGNKIELFSSTNRLPY
ncbi:MAG: VOC family protein [Candidatus Tectomicrobia bacterium]|uniref:VOC family protein n=1 Tax=Tectimicrobiota bacterium TaxID=2528274 RepID=A0A932MN76_UNCTE|nr:VOC family protein [Candidatus Tectomicrobia bacterium]